MRLTCVWGVSPGFERFRFHGDATVDSGKDLNQCLIERQQVNVFVLRNIHCLAQRQPARIALALTCPPCARVVHQNIANQCRSHAVKVRPVRDRCVNCAISPAAASRCSVTRSASETESRKVLEEASVKIGSVLSDVFGVSGQLILDALLEGKTTVEEVANLARHTARRKIPEIIQSLEAIGRMGIYRMLIRLSLEDLAFLEQQLQQIDAEILLRVHEGQPIQLNAPNGTKCSDPSGITTSEDDAPGASATALLNIGRTSVRRILATYFQKK